MAFVVYPGVTLLDLAGPLQVFSDARHESDGSLAYRIAVVSPEGGSIETDNPISLNTEPMSRWARRSIHTLVVVGGAGAQAAADHVPLVRQVVRLATRAERVCSVCTGAFVLAATGFLDNRRAVTHWKDCEALADAFPSVNVEIDPIFVKDGNVWTSAGITAGIDLALAMVAEDLGHANAVNLARSLVTYMVRPGGQSQFSPALDCQSQDASDRFNELHAWIVDHVDGDLRVERLAERVNMSARNFSRVYAAEIGRTPAKTVEAFRVEAARRLLETTSLSVQTIAVRCGFFDDERMRRAFTRTLNTSPNDYRQRFRIVDVHSEARK